MDGAGRGGGDVSGPAGAEDESAPQRKGIYILSVRTGIRVARRSAFCQPFGPAVNEYRDDNAPHFFFQFAFDNTHPAPNTSLSLVDWVGNEAPAARNHRLGPPAVRDPRPTKVEVRRVRYI